jgi:hypothetical protein
MPADPASDDLNSAQIADQRSVGQGGGFAPISALKSARFAFVPSSRISANIAAYCDLGHLERGAPLSVPVGQIAEAQRISGRINDAVLQRAFEYAALVRGFY